MRPLIIFSIFISFLTFSLFKSTALAGELNSAKTAAEVVEDFHDEAEDMAGEIVSSGTIDRMNGLKEKALKEIDGINLSQKPGEARYNNLRDAVSSYMDGVVSILEGAAGDKDELKAATRRLKASKAQGLSRLEEVHKQEVSKGAEGPPVPSVDRPRYEDKDGAADIWYR
ncbi:MAG: hypothetical protein HY956_11810 [Deltaproteobacteria bacterium]|nr:hypothetical protein [Deltaproteobacteria bacterium]